MTSFFKCNFPNCWLPLSMYLFAIIITFKNLSCCRDVINLFPIKKIFSAPFPTFWKWHHVFMDYPYKNGNTRDLPKLSFFIKCSRILRQRLTTIGLMNSCQWKTFQALEFWSSSLLLEAIFEYFSLSKARRNGNS